MQRHAPLALILLVASATAQQHTNETPTQGANIPVFRAESRQILVGAIVWKNNGKKTASNSRKSDIGDALKEVPQWAQSGLRESLRRWQPARGLAARDFHLFDNGTEQTVNYFKETDFVAVNPTGHWTFWPTTRGLWGTPWPEPLVGIQAPRASYVIGYVPPALSHGECHDIKAIVAGGDVRLSRDRYCDASNHDAIDAVVQKGTPLGKSMREFASSDKRGSIRVWIKALGFRSSRVLSLVQQPVAARRNPPTATAGFTFAIEVHDSKAPARVQVVTEFASPSIRREFRNGKCQLSLYVLGMLYNTNGELLEELGDRYDEDFFAPPVTSDPDVCDHFIPHRYDTQIDLLPGQYELSMVVSDGRGHFGRARVPVEVEGFQGDHLSISDIAVSNLVRPSSEILEDETLISPASIIPTPLLSNDVQFFPAADTQFNKQDSLAVYFEVYEPLLKGQQPAVTFQVRVIDLKNGAIRDFGPMKAAAWMQPGDPIVPVAITLGLKTLTKGSYRIEVQASDSVGRQTPWRRADFVVK